MAIHKPDNCNLFVPVLTLLLTLPLFSAKVAAQGAGTAYSVLHSFGDGSVANDGNTPYSGLTLGSDGNFYGTTYHGGSASAGTVFKMTPTGAVTILHSFGDGSVANDGYIAQAALTLGSDGNFYGTTIGGGSAGVGTVFKMTPAGVVTIVHSFGDGSVAGDGADPQDTLIQGSDGNFYGTTFVGGTAGNGTVFTIAPDGTYTILHSFGDGTVADDGINPYAALIQGSDGNFYGTTELGGSTIATDPDGQGFGTVFKMTPAGVVTILHSFDDGSVVNDGNSPSCGLTLGSDSNFYGTTVGGGSTNNGAVFKMTPAGVVTILHSFDDGSVDNDASLVTGDLILGSDGNFYGVSLLGGTPGNGSVFRVTATGTVTILHSFSDGSFDNDGVSPWGALTIGLDGNFYGVTLGGGSTGAGTVFRLSLPTHFAVSAPPSATAGSAFNVTVTALNDAGSPITDYAGTVHFTSTDPTAVLPADTAITNGTGSAPITLYSAATKTIRVRDTVTTALTGTVNVPVNAAAFDHFTFTAPTTATAGTAFYTMLSALDAYNNVVKSFADTIHISSTDTSAVLPANFVLTGGAKQLSIKLQMPGTQTITAMDANNSLAVTSGSINVVTVATKYLITGPATSTVGASNTYTITAKDNVGNTVTGYTGTVHFTTTDPNATVPADTTLVSGTGTFQVTFQTKGAQKVNANDTVSTAVKGLAATTVK